MTGPRVEPPWDDAAIDRVLEDALSVEPSPAFRARVRARVAEEPLPAPDRAWLMWSATGAAAAGLLVAAALGMLRFREPPAVVSAPVPVAQPFSPSASPGESPGSLSVAGPGQSFTSPAVARRSPAVRARASVVDAAAAGDSRGPAARFDPAERRAFAWFLSLSAGDTPPAPSTLPPVHHDLDVSVFPIEIPAIDVSPIEAAGGDQGEPQP